MPSRLKTWIVMSDYGYSVVRSRRMPTLQPVTGWHKGAPFWVPCDSGQRYVCDIDDAAGRAITGGLALYECVEVFTDA